MKRIATSGTEILRRIDKRLAALADDGRKLSDRALSIAATGSPDTVRSIRRNIANGTQHGVSTETLERLALPLETTVEWLLKGSGPETPNSDKHIDSEDVLQDSAPPRRVKIVGYVGAGSIAHYYAVANADELDTVEAPLGSSDQTVAAEVRGKSLGPLMDHWLVFYDDVRSPITHDMIGELCVVGLSNDQILVKQIKRERDGSFTLLSNSNEEPIKNAEIEWGALVTSLRPKT